MKREQMEHILRAAAAVTREKEFIVLGSQALLAVLPELPPPLAYSMELDLYPAENPAAADLIDGTIGEMSPFHETFGYYAHGVGPETAVLPRNWKTRAIVVVNERTGQARALCVAPADLAASKLIAGRQKDLDFVNAMRDSGLIDRAGLLNLLGELEPEHRAPLLAWAESLPSGSKS